jgi:hypothetical protein
VAVAEQQQDGNFTIGASRLPPIHFDWLAPRRDLDDPNEEQPVYTLLMPASVDVELMGLFLEAQEAWGEAAADRRRADQHNQAPNEDVQNRSTRSLIRAGGLLKRMILDYPANQGLVPAGFTLEVDDTMELITFMLEGRSAAEEIRDTIAQAQTDQEQPDTTQDEPPIPLGSRSRNASPRSATSTDGRPRGGSAARGRRSGST